MIIMSTKELNFVSECLKGMDCRDCPVCRADDITWNQLEKDFTGENSDFKDDLQLYYMVKAKRKIFEQKKNGEYLTLSEPEALHMLSRY